MTRLYFGRIAPSEPQKEQLDGGGWSWRYKVRIFDKHPHDKSELADEDLPWAQVLMPVTAGSGAANFSTTPLLNQGDTVSIAYYDSEEQMPVITGVLPRTAEVSTGEPEGQDGYLPHTGFTENKDKNSKVEDDESNEARLGSANSPTPRSFSSVPGDVCLFANNCNPNDYNVSAVSIELQNLFNQLDHFSTNTNLVQSITRGSIDRIHSIVNPYVGQIFNNLFEELVPTLNSGLRALYQEVYDITFAATVGANPALAPELAKKAAEAAMVGMKPPIIILQDAISLLADEVVDELYGQVEDMVYDAIGRGNLDQIHDNLYNVYNSLSFAENLIEEITNLTELKMSPLIDAVQKILSGGFRLDNVLSPSLDSIFSSVAGALSPSQSGGKCGGVSEYAFGVGEVSNLQNVYNEMFELDTTLQNFNPDQCGNPVVTIFGGRGKGATAEVVVGAATTIGDDRVTYQGKVLSVEVTNQGEGYEYPPFVKIQDSCGLGIGAIPKAVVKDKKVVAIYLINTGSGYPTDEDPVLIVDGVEIVDGGLGYAPGVITDDFDNDYEVVTDENGTITDVIPQDTNAVTDIPRLNIPKTNPPIPPGGKLVDGCIVDKNGYILTCEVTIGKGANLRPTLTKLPSKADIDAGNIPDNIKDRLSQEQILQIISCVE